jgi:hypothetical protein
VAGGQNPERRPVGDKIDSGRLQELNVAGAQGGKVEGQPRERQLVGIGGGERHRVAVKVTEHDVGGPARTWMMRRQTALPAAICTGWSGSPKRQSPRATPQSITITCSPTSVDRGQSRFLKLFY